MEVEGRVLRVFMFICIGEGRPQHACRQTGGSCGEKDRERTKGLCLFLLLNYCLA